jgi:hypothetical protein
VFSSDNLCILPYLMTAILRPISFVSVVLIVSLILASCGSGDPRRSGADSALVTAAQPGGRVPVQIGLTSITKAVYEHWMRIGEATVRLPVPGQPPPRPIPYDPPKFASCVASLKNTVPRSRATTSQLKAKCARTYRGVQERILNFLITGYWLRGAAAGEPVSITEAEVHRKFEAERRADYPTRASFHRLEQASRQTIPDLEFAVETRMLSAKLLQHFIKTHGHESEEAAIAAFNKTIRDEWVPKTSCATGYVVPDCKQYHPPKATATK